MSASNTKQVRREFDPAASEAQLLERARRLTRAATTRGADEAEVYAHQGNSITVTFEKGDLKLAQVDEGASLGLRVFDEKRLGFSSSNQVADADLDQTAEDALALARLNSPEDENRLAKPRELTGELLTAPASLCGFAVEEVVLLAKSITEQILAHDERISLETATVSTSCLSRVLVTSTGVERTESDAALSVSLMGMAIEGSDVGGFHVAGENLRDPSKFDAMAKTLAADFSRIIVGNLGAQSSESYKGAVVFSPEALISIFLSPVLSATSAIAVQRGRSALGKKLGESIANPVLTMIDDPTDLGLGGATAWDREGQPTCRSAIVENGVLKKFLYNGYAANVEGKQSTGHAQGGPRSTPGLGIHSLVVAPGDGGDLNALLASMGRGLFVERFSGSVDAMTGDFSGVAKSARWVEDGRIMHSVKETLLAGNVFDLLVGDLVLGSKSLRRRGSFRAPFAKVGGISVTAG